MNEYACISQCNLVVNVFLRKFAIKSLQKLFNESTYGTTSIFERMFLSNVSIGSSRRADDERETIRTRSQRILTD